MMVRNARRMALLLAVLIGALQPGNVLSKVSGAALKLGKFLLNLLARDQAWPRLPREQRHVLLLPPSHTRPSQRVCVL